MELSYDHSDSLTDRLTGTEQASIERCIKAVATTVIGTAPFMRDMGISYAFPANNSEGNRNAYVTDMLSALAEWEERVEVTEAGFIDDNTIKVVVSNG